MGPRSSRYLIFGLAVALAIVAVSFVLVRQLTVTSAADEPAMRMTVTDPAGACPGDGETCTVNPGQRFTLAVFIDEIPPGNPPDVAAGWVNAQSYVDYDDGNNALTYKQPGTGTGDDIGGQINPAVDCGGFKSGGQGLGQGLEPGEVVSHTCITSGLPPVASTYTGLFVTMDFACSAGNSVTTVELVPLNDAQAEGDGAGFVGADGASQFGASDELTINCEGVAVESPAPPGGPGAGATPTEQRLSPTGTGVSGDFDGEGGVNGASGGNGGNGGLNAGLWAGIGALLAAAALALAFFGWRYARRRQAG